MPSLIAKTTVLGYKNATHLLRRCSYAVTKEAIDAFALQTPQVAVENLFNYNSIPHPRPKTPNGEAYISTYQYPSTDPTVTGDIGLNVSYWWCFNSLNQVSLQFRLQFLLHTFFVTEKAGGDHWNNLDYTELITFYSKGSIKSLARDMVKNVKMLFYLDNRLNTGTSPNDNFAREFLELFTILKGEQISVGNYTNYTEQDVTQTQRVFSGFTSDINFNRLARTNNITRIPEGELIIANHDAGDKTFSSAFNTQTIIGGNTKATIERELRDYIDMVFNQLETAKNYVRRFYRYFVSREITVEIENDIITPLANTLKNNNYFIEPMLTQLLVSEHFYNEDNNSGGDEIFGSLIKSPLEYATQLFTVFKIPLPDYDTQTSACIAIIKHRILTFTTSTGLNIFQPDSVNGYPGYSEIPYDKNFLTTNSLRLRYNDLIDDLLTGFTLNGFQFYLNSVLFVKSSGYFSSPQTADILLQDFFDLLFVERPTGDRYAYFEQALLNGLSATNWFFVWNNYLSSNDDTDARLYLNSLITSLIKSPEYQVM